MTKDYNTTLRKGEVYTSTLQKGEGYSMTIKKGEGKVKVKNLFDSGNNQKLLSYNKKENHYKCDNHGTTLKRSI